ncbi:Uu.00g100010.m01.CDS01 [Anthostomella pinea]|uniref:Uu.00g100010.m01.CDS01 n=1 Tax=Anthostomella pinea TaxID=933095 RepID=A0AAI8YFA5_9PEZI|nr:Uu.00g100010.m01.CDS01 [Anthostomella pinea]
MPFNYVQGESESLHEKAVQKAGYPWVRINDVLPTRKGPFDRNQGIDRLLAHSHHGPNTHLIVKGDIEFNSHDDPANNIVMGVKKGQKEIAFKPPGLVYSAVSKSGGSFVEGHQCLSPRSAERYIDRGTLDVAFDVNSENDGGQDLPSVEVVKDRLVKAQFKPDTYPIMHFNRCPAATRGQQDAQKQIARWF